MAESRLSPSNLALELTESAWTVDSAETLKVIEDLRAAGFPMALDDFGAGYSSLSRLLDLGFDVIKVDGRMLVDVPGDSTAVKLLQAVFDLASACGTDIVAEGVETEAQLDFLISPRHLPRPRALAGAAGARRRRRRHCCAGTWSPARPRAAAAHRHRARLYGWLHPGRPASLLRRMAVPKQKQSHARTTQRRSQHKVKAATYNACPTCHSPRIPHRVCPVCGSYRGREVIAETGQQSA